VRFCSLKARARCRCSQARVIPVSDKQSEYAQKVAADLQAAGVRVDVDDDNDSLGKRIRNAKAEKIPYLLVVGDKEIEEGAVSVESREEKVGSMKTTEFEEKITKEITEKTQ
jgi:threonyl-tRNA synthetase